jgi:hypothetical protein
MSSITWYFILVRTCNQSSVDMQIVSRPVLVVETSKVVLSYLGFLTRGNFQDYSDSSPDLDKSLALQNI